MRIRMAVGVISPKKIIPSIIGLTINPSKRPNCIHILFRGLSALALNDARIIKNKAIKLEPYVTINLLSL